jgi:hypothetical protein
MNDYMTVTGSLWIGDFFPVLNSSNSDNVSSNSSGYTPKIRHDFPSQQTTITGSLLTSDFSSS